MLRLIFSMRLNVRINIKSVKSARSVFYAALKVRFLLPQYRSSRPQVFLKISQKFLGKHLCQGLGKHLCLCRPQVCNFIRKEA